MDLKLPTGLALQLRTRATIRGIGIGIGLGLGLVIQFVAGVVAAGVWGGAALIW